MVAVKLSNYESYEGQVNDDNLPNGKGKATYVNGITYDGDWINGKRQGYGIYRDPNNFIYQGFWNNNEFCGYGEIIPLDNETGYKGNFYQGEFHGFGKLYNLQNHEKYQGYWENGLRNGKGISINSEKIIYDGD